MKLSTREYLLSTGSLHLPRACCIYNTSTSICWGLKARKLPVVLLFQNQVLQKMKVLYTSRICSVLVKFQASTSICWGHTNTYTALPSILYSRNLSDICLLAYVLCWCQRRTSTSICWGIMADTSTRVFKEVYKYVTDNGVEFPGISQVLVGYKASTSKYQGGPAVPFHSQTNTRL